MTNVEVWRVNAFTNIPFSGNPAGVVPDADGLSEEMMQHIACELNDISETVFISTPQDLTADIRLRYFTSVTEVDLCGHATVAALFTLAWTGRLQAKKAAGTETRTVMAETSVGVLALGVTFVDSQLEWATMEQLTPQLATPTQPQLAAQVLGLSEEGIANTPTIGCCSTGIWACFVPVRTLDTLTHIQIQRELIEQLWPENDELTGIYAFALVDDENKICQTQGRFFSPPKYGIVEDPVTGTASGALGGYLIAQGILSADGVLYAQQGVQMGRAGLVQVRQNPNGHMTISGQAVAIFRGTLLV